jgi:hypothetical protein
VHLNLSTRTPSATLTLLLCATHIAPDCSVSGDTLNCHLQTILHFLYGAAWTLSLLLLVIVLIAIHIYRKNKNDRRNIP